MEFSKPSSEFPSLPHPPFANQQLTSEFSRYASLSLSPSAGPELVNQTPVTPLVKTCQGHQAGLRFQAQCNLGKAKKIAEIYLAAVAYILSQVD